MTNRTKTTVAALAAAVALSSGAYAIGTQAGGGTAGAADAGAGNDAAADARPAGTRWVHLRGGPGPLGLGGPGGPAGFCGRDDEDLAEELGVSEERLREALEAVRERLGAQRRDDLAEALAQSLGIGADRVREALEDQRPRPGRRGGLHARIDELAEALGVGEERLEDALRSLPDTLRERHEERRDEFAAALAEELGLPVDEVREALE